MLKSKVSEMVRPNKTKTKAKSKKNKSFGPSNWDENYTCLLPLAWICNFTSL